jgi:pimeloyl-ACP methyl ester carboxylesterase
VSALACYSGAVGGTRVLNSKMHLLCRGTGAAILFLPGMPTSSQLWSGIVDRMCGRFTCFAIDLPGLGKTPPEPYEPDYLHRLAKRIDALRIQNKIAKWHVVGHDAGSAIAAHYTHSFQEHVGRLALLSPALFPDLKPYCLLECLRKPLAGEILAPFIHFIFWNFAMRLAARNEEGVTSHMLQHFSEPFRGFAGPWNFMRVLRWGKPSDMLVHFPGMLPGIRVPTLIFHGSRDPAIAVSFARRAHELIPNCAIIHVDCGHFIPLNKPRFIADQLLQFFDNRSIAEESHNPPRKFVSNF